MTPTDERIHAMIAAIPPEDLCAGGVPNDEAVARIVKALSPAQQQEIAQAEIVRVTRLYMELLTAIGAARRINANNYLRTRDVTAAEGDAIRVLVESSLNGDADRIRAERDSR